MLLQLPLLVYDFDAVAVAASAFFRFCRDWDRHRTDRWQHKGAKSLLFVVTIVQLHMRWLRLLSSQPAAAGSFVGEFFERTVTSTPGEVNRLVRGHLSVFPEVFFDFLFCFCDAFHNFKRWTNGCVLRAAVMVMLEVRRQPMQQLPKETNERR